MRITTRIAGVALPAALLGCGEPSAPLVGPAFQVVALAGDSQVGPVHAELPLPIVVRVMDSQGRAVPGQVVSWIVTKGGGSVFAGVGEANPEGEVRERWTLGDTAGLQALEVRAVDQTTGAPLTLGRIVAIAQPGPLVYSGFAIRRLFVPVDSPLVLPLIAQDMYGNAVAAPPVSSLDSQRFGAATSEGRWIPTVVGFARFVEGLDTLRVTVIWPRQALFRAFWTKAGGALGADSGALSFVTLDTARVTGLCELQGTATYRTSTSARIALPICEYPGWVAPGASLSGFPGLPNDSWALRVAEGPGYWRHQMDTPYARDSVVIYR